MFNEFIGPAAGLTLNVEAFPLKLDKVSLSIRVGTTTEVVSPNAPTWNGFVMVYGVGAELGRRRSRFVTGIGMNTRYSLPGEYYFGRVETGSVRVNGFASLGYRFQMPWGLFFGLNAYLVLQENDERGCLVCTNDYYGPKLYPSFQVGFRLPSKAQHRWYRQLTKAAPAARDSLKQINRQQKTDWTIPDSLRVPGTGSSEFGFSVFGTALLNLHYNYLARLTPKGVAYWYIRPGIGTIEPVFQFQLETGAAFLWKNAGFTVGGGGNASLGVGWETFVVARGRVNLRKGLSASLGVSLIWSESAPYFSYVPKRSGNGWVMPSISFAYRLPRRRL